MPQGYYKDGTRRIHSEETKRKIGLGNKNKFVSEETKEKIRFANLGKKPSEETKKEMSKSQKGKKHYNWQGGKIRTTKGYIFIYKSDHPFCDKNSYVPEHRLVMEKMIGRYLKPKEVVHHCGTKYPMGSFEDRGDNRIENLKLCKNNTEHMKFHKH